MKKLLAINLIVLGVIVGILFSLTLVSCSTDVDSSRRTVEPSGDAAITPAISDARTLQQTFRAVSRAALPSVVQIDVEEVRTQATPDGESEPWFDFFFGEPDSEENGEGEREFRTQGLGSGVIVRRRGDLYYVLTNDHVIGNANAIT
ncbi:MAG: serine protease, partial [Alkalispirochaeta sp.]